ncbi:hypothetical protein CSC2_04570 [Clostridium zeae]|uniref:Uncharacterized protein n=1 Tax=Clostridium zeae TaxID=2759022 RepID=A0ABQ1E5C3_9CLOT|nr:hypothetical protein [Clostridium zeae]GFZ29931.1 hypothetical protein CSC2_04570 [Clostridium zeae]
MRYRYVIFTVLFTMLYVISITSSSFSTIFYNATSKSEEGVFLFKTGKYYAKTKFVGNGGKRDTSWDISISDKQTRKNIIENEENSGRLQNFKDMIVALRKMKSEVFNLIISVCLFLAFSIMSLLDKSIKINIIFKILLVLPLLFISFFLISGMNESLSNLKSLDKSISEVYSLIP